LRSEPGERKTKKKAKTKTQRKTIFKSPFKGSPSEYLGSDHRGGGEERRSGGVPIRRYLNIKWEAREKEDQTGKEDRGVIQPY